MEYNKSTGVIRDEDNQYRWPVELTRAEMRIAEVLFDWKWHSMEEVEEKTGIERQRRRVQISKMKKKIKRYIVIKIDRKGRRYRCVKIKRKQEKQ